MIAQFNATITRRSPARARTKFIDLLCLNEEGGPFAGVDALVFIFIDQCATSWLG